MKPTELPDWTQCLEQHLRQWYVDNDPEARAKCPVYKMTRARFDAVLIEFALRSQGGNITRSARMLGINVGTLRSRSTELNINPNDFRTEPNA